MTSQNSNRLSFFNPKILLGILLSGIGIYFAFHDFNFTGFKNSIQKTNFPLVVLSALILVGSVYIRAVRWRYLVKHEMDISTDSLFQAEMIGYFGNNVLPLRLGELLRTYFVSRDYKISGSFVFGSVVFERLLDTFGLLSLSVLLILTYPLPEDIRRLVIFSIIVVVVVSGLLILFIKKYRNSKSSNRFFKLFIEFLSGFNGLQYAYRWRVIALTLFLWIIYWTVTHLIQTAMHLEMSIFESLLVLIISSLALSIPSAPGMIGTFHLSVKFVLVTMIGKFQAEEGISYAIMLHAYGYITLTIIGAYYFIKNKIHLNVLSDVMSITKKHSNS
ncbi:MAG: flippase-like domain-containing protein [Candidatus Marinimicrobia bacterium]|nr:flippase-like domain-containing protein [Candidatus Neomarinimicrobiota bacterium]MBL7109667.1 flippase-like domain-containing protein [Candidatus Neomarinimicrobiota bacterium]